jgi:hypothetical protein
MEPSRLQTPRRQFSLAGLLSYMLAASVYFSMIASVRPLITESPRTPMQWPAVATIPTAWFVLWALYRRWRLPHALRVHYAGPVIVLCILLPAAVVVLAGWMIQVVMANPVATVPSFLECSWVAAAGLLIGGGLSAAVSLPAATAMLLYLCTRPVAADRK